MKIRIKLFADLRHLDPTGGGGDFSLDVDPGSTVGQVLDGLAIPPGKPRILLVNGLHAKRSSVLAEGATLAVFPPVAGG